MATTGQMKCDDCTAKTTSAARSVALTDCLGDAGYSGNGGNVAACEVGTFKSEAASSAACKDCAVGTFAAVAASTFCPACPNHSTSPAKSDEATDCACSVGYAGNITGSDMPADDKPADDKPADEKKKKRQMRRLMGKPSTAGDDSAATTITAIGSCDMCLAGTFKDSSGNGECTPCPANSNSSVGATLLNQCFGNVGYGGSGNSVSACSAGYSKKDAMSAADCTACSRGFSTNNLTTQAGCTACAVGFFSPIDGSPACIDCGEGSTTTSAGQYWCYVMKVMVRAKTSLRGYRIEEFDVPSVRSIFKNGVAKAFNVDALNVVITGITPYVPSTLLSSKAVLLGGAGSGTSAEGVTVQYAIKNVKTTQKDALIKNMETEDQTVFQEALVSGGMTDLQEIIVYDVESETQTAPSDSNATLVIDVTAAGMGDYQTYEDNTTYSPKHEAASVVGDDFPWWMWYSTLAMIFVLIGVIIYANLKRCHNQRVHDNLVREMGPDDIDKLSIVDEEDVPSPDCEMLTASKPASKSNRLPQSEDDERLLSLKSSSVAPAPAPECVRHNALPPLSKVAVQEDRIRDHFDIFDTDGSGLLSKDEFRVIMQLGDGGLDDEDFEELYCQIDANGVGEVDFEEYVAWAVAGHAGGADVDQQAFNAMHANPGM
jgi:hypothetical protein